MHNDTHTSPSPLRRAGLGVLAIGLAAGMAACGSSSSSSSSGSPSASSSAAASATASGSASASTAASASSAASASATPSATPTKKATLVTSLDAITVTPTTPGKLPTVTGKWPLAINKTQVKVLTQGTGAVIPAGATVKVNYHGVNASTGKVFDSSLDPKIANPHVTPATFSLNGVVAGFTKAIQGQRIGSRVVVFMTAADGYGPQGGSASAGIGKDDNLIFVIDILGGPTPVTPKAGLPTVKDDAKGNPVVTVPKTAAPTQAESETLVKGAGDPVKVSNQILINYRTYDWATGKQLEDGYTGQGQVATVQNLLPALQKAIVGQPVGSRVLVVLPPSALAAANSSASPSTSKQTIVFVIDIRQAG